VPKNTSLPLPTLTAPPASAPRSLWLLGPALVAGVAYLDPGNVASNMTAGAQYGYLLVWVVLAGNVMAWLIQYLSAKLGVVTGQSLPEVLGTRLRRPWARRAYWLQAELVAMATDLAEVIGGAVALNLLFDVPLLLGGLITGAVSMILLTVQNRGGARPFEFVIIGLMAIITIGFVAGVFVAPPDPAGVLGGMVPRFEGTGSVLLAASILGATIMPHAIYAHSSLARDRFGATTAHAGDEAVRTETSRIRRLLTATRWDV
jgi:manganese transport protein